MGIEAASRTTTSFPAPLYITTRAPVALWGWEGNAVSLRHEIV